MARLPQISITPVQYNPYVFEPQKVQGLKFDTPNIGGLMEHNNSLMIQVGQQEENRRKETDTARATFETAVKDLRSRLGDEKDLSWFDNVYAPKYRERIEQYARNGDIGSALKEAKLAAAEIGAGAEYNARVNSWNDYQEQITAAKTNPKIHKDDLQAFIEYNGYEFKGKQDENGNVVGYEKFKPKVGFNTASGGQLTERIDFNRDIVALAIDIVAQESNSKSTGSQTSNENNFTNSLGGGTGSSTSNQNKRERAYTKKDTKKLLETAWAVAANPNNYEKIMTTFNAEKRNYDNLVKELDEATNSGDIKRVDYLKAQMSERYGGLFNATGGFVSIDKYIKNQCTTQLKNAGFKNISESDWNAVGTSKTTKENPVRKTNADESQQPINVTVNVGDSNNATPEAETGEVHAKDEVKAEDRGGSDPSSRVRRIIDIAG